MPYELVSSEFTKALEIFDNPKIDAYPRFDLTQEDSSMVKAFMSDNGDGALVNWANHSILMKARTERAVLDLLEAVPQNPKLSFLLQDRFASLVKRKFKDKEEKRFSINCADRNCFKPLEEEKYEVLPLSVDYAPEVTKFWNYSGGDTELVTHLIKKRPGYMILDGEEITSWVGSFLVNETDKLIVIGMGFTLPEYREQGRASSIISRFGKDYILEKGYVLRGDIEVNNTASLGAARKLGFGKIDTYTRLEPLKN
jgi:hypothetical protein